MANLHHLPGEPRHTLMRYFIAVLFGVAIVVVGVKIAVDHWPCDFMPRGTCHSGP